MFELESVILGAVFFDEKKEFVNLADLNESLFENKSLFKKVTKWRSENKPYDVILGNEIFSQDELKMLNSGVSRMVTICNYPHYLNLFKRKTLELRISQQIENKDINPDTLRQYIDAVNNSVIKEKIFNYETDLHEYLERFEERAMGKFERYSLDMPGLDELLGLVRPKRFYTVGASSGVGKTNLMLKIMLKQMSKEVPCLFFTAEMDYDSLVERMSAMNSGLRLFDITNARLRPEHITEYVNSIEKYLYGKKSYIFETPRFNTNKIKDLIDKTGAKFIFVDYLQKFNLEGARNQTPAFVMNNIANGLKEITMEKNVIIFAGSQFGAHADRTNPKSSDLKESGGILEASDGLILIGEISEDDDYKKLRLDVAKNKYGITGRIAYAMDRKSCNMEFSYLDTEALRS
jgi:replicative DNA helicase